MAETVTGYRVHICVGETLSQLCKIYRVNINDTITLNTQSLSSDEVPREIYSKYKQSYQTVKGLLSDFNSKNRSLPKNLPVRIYQLSEGEESSTIDAMYYSELEDDGNMYFQSAIAFGVGDYTPISSDYQKFNCSYTLYYDGTAEETVYLPIFPNEFSSSTSATFTSVNILNRSQSPQVYTGTSRNYELSLVLHADLLQDPDKVRQIVADLESACYPEYEDSSVEVPEILIVIGSQFKVRGVVTSCSASWSAPIVDDYLVNCNVSLSIVETSGPFSASQVRSKKGVRDI